MKNNKDVERLHVHKIVIVSSNKKNNEDALSELVKMLDDGYDIYSENVVGSDLVYVLRKYIG